MSGRPKTDLIETAYSPDFWTGKTVLVTGHTGFKGAWLCWWLTRMGASVTGYALSPPESKPNLYRGLDLSSVTDSIYGDIRDRDRLAKVIAAVRPVAVFHLAAQAIVRSSYVHPRDTFEINVVGTANLLDAVRSCADVLAVVVVTSDKCYRKRHDTKPYVEGDALGGDDPYSASKAAQEIVSSSYRSSFFEERPLLATVRAGNVIGGGDWSVERLVPDIIEALIDRQPLLLRYPDAIRPWQHVLEPLAAYLEIGARLVEGQTNVADAWNIGPSASDHLTVAEIARRFFDTWGRTPEWIQPIERQPPEAPVLRLDASKARSHLGLHPRFDVETACRYTAAWYRGWSQGSDMRRLCNADIDAFERSNASP